MFIKAIHLNKQLVECLLTLIIPASARISSLATDGINLIDKDDTWRMLFCLFEEIAHSGRTDTNKHLDKLRTAHTVESNSCFTSDSTRDQGFASTRSPHKQHAFRSTSPHCRKTLRMFQKLDNFLQLHLCLFNSCHILKKDGRTSFAKAFCPRTCERSCLTPHIAASDSKIHHPCNKSNQEYINSSLQPLTMLATIDTDTNAVFAKFIR